MSFFAQQVDGFCWPKVNWKYFSSSVVKHGHPPVAHALAWAEHNNNLARIIRDGIEFQLAACPASCTRKFVWISHVKLTCDAPNGGYVYKIDYEIQFNRLCCDEEVVELGLARHPDAVEVTRELESEMRKALERAKTNGD